MHVIVTAGGTAEPIDDVRSVTNFSSGRFPIAIAKAFRAAGDDVIVLASREAALRIGSQTSASWYEPPELTLRHFGDTDSLAVALGVEAGQVPATEHPASCVVVHAAAVSDYRPIRHHGKLPSDAEAQTITMLRTPKVIATLRDTYGKKAFLVGFKLTSGAAPADTIAEARKQIAANHLNLCVANDLSECHDGEHPCWLVTPEGGALRLEGTRDQVARRITAFIARRANVTWSATNVVAAGTDAPVVDATHRALMSSLISFAHRTDLLPGHDGNIAVRIDDVRQPDAPELFVSPRQVDKSKISVGDCLTVRAVLAEHRTDCFVANISGDVIRPSIDTSVQARILAARAATAAILHTHEMFGRSNVRTHFPLPCGAAEEAELVVGALADIGHHRPNWVVELVEHGYVIGLNDAGLARLNASYDEAVSRYMIHLVDVGAILVPGTALRPIIDVDVDGSFVVGVVAVTADGVAVHVNEDQRGSGIGRIVTRQLIERRLQVVTIDKCGVIDYWAAQGFGIERRPDRTVVCVPPPVPATTLV